mgnify:CR=1 FL=1
MKQRTKDIPEVKKKAVEELTNLINTKNVKVKSYKDIDEYENDRSNISYTLTPEQLKQQAIRKQHQEIEEENRVRRIQ